jgi:dTDP-4-dehydrorhamnose 3,5-epimerase-like enzyme
MSTVWQPIEARGFFEIPGLPGVCGEALPVFKDPRGSLPGSFRVDEIQQELNPHSSDQLPQS